MMITFSVHTDQVEQSLSYIAFVFKMLIRPPLLMEMIITTRFKLSSTCPTFTLLDVCRFKNMSASITVITINYFN